MQRVLMHATQVFESYAPVREAGCAEILFFLLFSSTGGGLKKLYLGWLCARGKQCHAGRMAHVVAFAAGGHLRPFQAVAKSRRVTRRS